MSEHISINSCSDHELDNMHVPTSGTISMVLKGGSGATAGCCNAHGDNG